MNSVKRTSAGIVYLLLILANLIAILSAQPALPEGRDLSRLESDAWTESGIPYIRNFRPAEYRGEFQNWSVAQGPQGFIYVANNDGLLQYDGANWRISPTNGTMRSLAIDGQGRIYAGTDLDLGYFEADSLGLLHFKSLQPQLDEKYRDFNQDVWYTLVHNDTVYFMTAPYVFRWDGNAFKVWPAEETFQTMHLAKGRVYLQQRNIGLQEVVGDSLITPTGAEVFKLAGPYMMLPHEDDALLIGTFFRGLYVFDDQGTRAVDCSASDFIKKHRLYCSALLSNDLIALGTLGGGIGIMDRRGNLLQVIDKNSGLQDNSVTWMAADAQQGLWVSLLSGISRIEVASPITSFPASEGVIEDLVRYKGKMYLALSQGLRSLEPINMADLSQGVKPERLQPAFGISYQCYSLLADDAELLVGNTNGIRRIIDDGVSKMPPYVSTVFRLLESRTSPGTMFVAARNGLGVLAKVNDRWTHKGWLPVANFPVYDVEEDSTGTLWLARTSGNITRVIIEEPGEAIGDTIPATVTHFSSDANLPAEPIFLAYVDGGVTFSGSKGALIFDESQQKFIPDPRLSGSLAPGESWGYFGKEDHHGKLWASRGYPGDWRLGYGERDLNGELSWVIDPFRRIKNLNAINMIYPEENGVTWIASDKLLRYDSRVPMRVQVEFQTHIRKVILKGDSIIYYGNRNVEPLRYGYEMNSIRFDFSATSFDLPEANQFQSRLVGFDDQWSAWTTEVQREFTNLSEGDYYFEVRSQNVHGMVGQAAGFRFEISPPWFRSWWAYLLYLAGAGAIIALIVKSRVRQLERKTEELEAMIAKRTTQVRQQAEKLQEIDKLKSRFFANISHEFRTPLTLILGPLQDVMGKVSDGNLKQELGLVRRNAGKLLGLINQLLDLSRLESGKMDLQLQQGNFSTFLRGLVVSFSSLAEQKQISLQLQIEEDTAEKVDQELYYDRDKIEKIINNLLSNAFKFTPDGGRIQVIASVEKAENQAGEELHIRVADTGVGIPVERLPYIFDRFYQVDSAHTREYEGTGIGLALTKELIERHYGRIAVESKSGAGSTFVVALPLGKNHLRELDQILDAETVADPQATTAETEAEIIAQPAPPMTPADQTTIVLVIDDHIDIRRYIRGRLGDHYQILEADNGEAGVAMAIEHVPDLIVSDVMMPKMDGYGVCEAVKTNPKTSHIPVILLTAKAGEESKLAGLETGADDYLTKPFSSDELQVRVRNLIELRRKLREKFRREGILQPEALEVTSVEEVFLLELKKVLEDHMAEEDFSIDVLCRELGMSERQLQRKLRALTGQRPTEVIRDARLQRAKSLLEQHAGNVSEVAFEVGFNNLSYFAKCFREKYNISPSEFVKQTK